jgi:uncharacterized Zn finger protein
MGQDTPAFDPSALRDLVGDVTFARGEAYWRDGRVEILSLGPKRVVARVSGTEEYRTAFTLNAEGFIGKCSCPAFSDTDFCKHLVATGLAVNALNSGNAADTVSQIGPLAAYLDTLSPDVLVNLLLEVAERDKELRFRLEMLADLAGEDDKKLEARCRKDIDAATRTRGFVDYRTAQNWARGVDETLDTVSSLVEAGRAAPAMRLALHAVARIEKAMDSIDDSTASAAACSIGAARCIWRQPLWQSRSR